MDVVPVGNVSGSSSTYYSDVYWISTAAGPDDLTAEGQTRADTRNRIRGTANRIRIHDTAIHIRVVEPTINHTAGSGA